MYRVFSVRFAVPVARCDSAVLCKSITSSSVSRTNGAHGTIAGVGYISDRTGGACQVLNNVDRFAVCSRLIHDVDFLRSRCHDWSLDRLSNAVCDNSDISLCTGPNLRKSFL